MAQNQIKSLSHTHDQIITWLIANPERPHRDCAMYFRVTQAWLSTVIHSDLFQQKLQERQEKLASTVIASVHDKLTTASHLALDGLTRRLEDTEDPDFLLSATDKLLTKMGYGAKTSGPSLSVTNNITTQTVDPALLAESRALLSSAKRVEDPTEKEVIDVIPETVANADDRY